MARKAKKQITPSYLMKEFNHKVDNNPAHTAMVNRARKCGVKHPGSKAMRQLKRYAS